MGDRLKLAAVPLLVLVISGCRKDEPTEVDMGYGYFPKNIGTWVEYQVDSLWRDDASDVLDSVSYRLLERIEDDHTDAEGRPAQRILRYVKDDDDQWVVRDVWTSFADGFAAERTEENLRRLKLSFPVRNGRSWDMNVYNTEDELKVAYREKESEWSGNGLTVANTVLVKNTVPPNAVDDKTFEERYGLGIGLLEKRWVDMNTQTIYDVNSQQFRTEQKGWIMSMMAVAYGAE